MSRPTVAVLARVLQDDLRGVGGGLFNLLPFLATDARVALVIDRGRPPPVLPEGDYELIEAGGRGLPTATLWRQVAVPAALIRWPGIVHGPFNAVPAAVRQPLVLTIHDLSFEHHRWMPPLQRAMFRAQARLGARMARAVVTVTEHVRADLIATYGLDPESVHVVPNAVDPAFRQADAARGKTIVGTADYLLTLDGAQRRGAHLAVAGAAILAAQGRTEPLVVASPLPTTVLGPGVIPLLGGDTWRDVMAGAKVFIYPTEFEGFGMPALEAASLGVPVVCPPIGPLLEVLGDAAIWTGVIPRRSPSRSPVCSANPTCTRAATAGRNRAEAAPDWEAAASALLSVYREVARG